jgi:hypothetical protein
MEHPQQNSRTFEIVFKGINIDNTYFKDLSAIKAHVVKFFFEKRGLLP